MFLKMCWETARGEIKDFIQRDAKKMLEGIARNGQRGKKMLKRKKERTEEGFSSPEDTRLWLLLDRLLGLGPYGPVSSTISPAALPLCPHTWHFDTGTAVTNSWSFHLLSPCLDCAKSAQWYCSLAPLTGPLSQHATDRGLYGWLSPAEEGALSSLHNALRVS